MKYPRKICDIVENDDNFQLDTDNFENDAIEIVVIIKNVMEKQLILK